MNINNHVKESLRVLVAFPTSIHASLHLVSKAFIEELLLENSYTKENLMPQRSTKAII